MNNLTNETNYKMFVRSLGRLTHIAKKMSESGRRSHWAKNLLISGARILCACCVLQFSPAHGSLPLKASLKDLSCKADHVFLGRVIGVDMVDAEGRPIQDNETMTGPGLNNTIRLEVEILEVIDSTQSNAPSTLKIPLDPFMHYSLGQIKQVYSGKSSPKLVFLRGVKHEPIIAGRFFWSAEEREQAMDIRRECKEAAQ